MRDFQEYISRTFQALKFSRKNPGLSMRRGNPECRSTAGSLVRRA